MNHLKMKNGDNYKQSTRIKGLKLRIGQGGGRKVHYKIRLKRSHKHSHNLQAGKQGVPESSYF